VTRISRGPLGKDVALALFFLSLRGAVGVWPGIRFGSGGTSYLPGGGGTLYPAGDGGIWCRAGAWGGRPLLWLK
jgi:hypothetical protein